LKIRKRVTYFIDRGCIEDKPRKEPTPPPTIETAPTVEEKDKTPADEEESLRKKIAARLPQTAKIRPWDEGKEGVPSTKQGVQLLEIERCH